MKSLLLDHLPEDWILPEGPSYRRQQLCQWVFKKRAVSFDVMSNLPQEWRQKLAQSYSLDALKLEKTQGSSDTTLKYLWRLQQGDFIESVLIPASAALYGEKSDRHTLCLSTQVGCAYGCKFCASGLEGWKRNLSPGEIIAQIIESERHGGKKVNNLVFMGMGEPLANFKNLMRAIHMINAPWGLHIGARHITISTSGLVPQIKELADQPLQLQLAISFHGATDAVRSRIMPINKKYPLTELLEACRYYVSKKQKIITFEYILIRDINDMASEARMLANHAKTIGAKINLIPYNRVEGLAWDRPSEERIDAFAKELRQNGVRATLRCEKGDDIDAACGQLRLQQMNKTSCMSRII